MGQNQSTENKQKKDSQQQSQAGRNKEIDPNNPTARGGNQKDKKSDQQQQNENVSRQKPYSKNVETEEMDEQLDDEQTNENDIDKKESPQNEGFSGNQNPTSNW